MALTDRGGLTTLVAAGLPHARPESIQALASSATLRRVGAGERIWSQGEAIHLTLIVDGYGAFVRTTVNGQELITSVVRPGETYGMIAIAGSLAAADLVALTDCQLAMWPGPAVRQIAQGDPDLGLDVIDRLASLLILITERLDGFLHQDARRRVIRVLARYGDLFFADPPILTRAQLPRLVGTSREMTARVLRALEREGTIARVGRTGLRLVDPAILRTGEDGVSDVARASGARSSR